MRLSERNKSPIYYALYDGTETTIDPNGLMTGENPPRYTAATLARMVVGTETGTALLEQFGIADAFNIKLVTDETDCPITTSSIVWLGLGYVDDYEEETEYQEGAVVIKDGVISKLTDGKWKDVPYTHAVIRVSVSKGYIAYLLRQVEVS